MERGGQGGHKLEAHDLKRFGAAGTGQPRQRPSVSLDGGSICNKHVEIAPRLLRNRLRVVRFAMHGGKNEADACLLCCKTRRK